jgi:ABC-type transporter Mla maintaining outer membrane lipid asymmetry permease subunit MlaE
MGTLIRTLASRRQALAMLWAARADWRRPAPRALLRRERDAQLVDLMPVVGLIGLMVGVALFPTLAGTLGDNYPAVLAAIWPLWATQAAPLVAVLALAARRLPGLALDLARREADGEFAAQARLGVSAATYPGVPWVLAHAWVTLAATGLLVVGSLLLGLLAGGIVNSGDPRLSFGIALDTLPPIAWLRALATAWLLGALGAIAGLLVAWPGGESAVDGLAAHRLGVRAMGAAALVSMLALPLLNALFRLLGL